MSEDYRGGLATARGGIRRIIQQRINTFATVAWELGTTLGELAAMHERVRGLEAALAAVCRDRDAAVVVVKAAQSYADKTRGFVDVTSYYAFDPMAALSALQALDAALAPRQEPHDEH